MIYFFNSGMAGAPTLNNSAGTLLAVLDACLVNGFGLGTPDSIVVSGGIATVTRGAGHPFEIDSVALISGVTTPAGLNGEKKVLSHTTTTYTFDATGISDQTATGTITHKLAPAGWEILYTATNKRAYRSTDAAGTQCVLRLDDSGTTTARGLAFKSMTSIDVGADQFPSTSQVSGGTYWPKSNDSTVRPWMIVADSRAFYMYVAPYGEASINWRDASFFGDIVGNKSPDPYGCLHNAPAATLSTSQRGDGGVSYVQGSALNGAWLCRGVSGFDVSIPIYRAFNNLFTYGAKNSGAVSTSLIFPNPGDNGLYLSKVHIAQANVYRGDYPGLYSTPCNLGVSAFTTGQRLTDVTGIPGRRFVAFLNYDGCTFIDVTGPWR
jgi:hypothetical protein